jgi:tRNA A37 threonylcarbamoyladenosine dehydratase
MAVHPFFQRLALITGDATVESLGRTRAFVFGVGGVGSWCAEALVRSGIGRLVIVDSDTICESNVNRQLEATSENIGKPKVEELRDRLLQVNPSCEIRALQEVYSQESSALFDIQAGDFVIDAIDTLTSKLDLIEHATASGATLYSSMGAAAKLDPTRLRVADIWDTQGCPLAKLVRSGLRKRGFTGHFNAVYSTEQCLSPEGDFPRESVIGPGGVRKLVNGSAVHVTATAGMILAGLVVQDIRARMQSGYAIE